MKVFYILLLVSLALAKHEEYEGSKSYYVLAQSREQLKLLNYLFEQNELDIFVQPAVQREGVVIVKPEHQARFISTVQQANIQYRVHSEDVAQTLRSEDVMLEQAQKKHDRNGRTMTYDSYQRLEVFDQYLHDVASRYPDKVTLVSPAVSFDGRPIYYVKISTTNFEDQSKPIIFIDGGAHAREWISPPTVTWAIHKLVEDVTEPDLLEKFDWILLPVVNPDGYEFTHTHNRFWRKTRSTNASPASAQCPGVDINRNFDFFWNTVGSSSNACFDNYAGNVAFSEIETKVVRDVILENLNRMAMYITMHSFGSLILYPWGHDGSLSNNALALHIVGVEMANAIDAMSLPGFPNYIVGNAALVLYGASGAAEDYAHSVGVPLSYTYELPGPTGGFVLNPDFIEPVCRETWAGLVAGARRAATLLA